MKHYSKRNVRSPLIRALEPRMLYDGAAVATAAEVATDLSFADHGDLGGHAGQHDTGSHDTHTILSATNNRAFQQAKAAVEADKSTSRDSNRDNQRDNQSADSNRDGDNQQTAVFIDADVENARSLADKIGHNPNTTVFMVDGDANGLAQVVDTLDQSGDQFDSVAIIGHGESSEFTLGSADVSADTLGQYNDALQHIGNILGDNGSLLLYGCNVADGAAGQAFVDSIADTAGISVGASTDNTGAAAYDGNWTLEYSTGDIDAHALDVSGYDGVLADPTVETPDENIVIDEDTAGEVSGISIKVPDTQGTLDVTLSVDHGTLEVGNAGDATVSSNNGELTLSGSADAVNAALESLQYQGSKNYNGTDTLTIEADYDGATTSTDVDIHVTPVNDEPTLDPNDNISADEGGSYNFKDGDFGIDDPDLDETLNSNPQIEEQEVIEITGLPSEGTLTFDGHRVVEGSTFSMTEIGKLKYTHDGTDVSRNDTDSFTIQVNDGGAVSDETTINIGLNPVNQAPEITGDLNPSVHERQGQIADGNGNEGIALGLGYSDYDNADKLADATVEISNVNLNGHGTLYIDKDGDGKFGSGDTKITGDFTLTDPENLANLRFNANDKEPGANAPTFDVTVTDNGGGEGGEHTQTTTETVEINIIENDDDPVLDTNTGTAVDGGDTIGLTDSMLKATDNDSADTYYVLQSHPEHGELQLKDSDGWHILGKGAIFAQSDIDAGWVQYVQKGTVSANDTDSFDFKVYDGELKSFGEAADPGAARDNDGAIETYTFNIDIQTDHTGSGPGTPDPIEPVLDSETNVGFTGGDTSPNESNDSSDDGGAAKITSDNLDYTLVIDGDNTRQIPADQTYYRITSLPDNGRLQLKDGDGKWHTLEQYGTFTQADIDNGDVRFVHDGSENHQSSFDFSISAGGKEVTDGTFEIKVNATNDRPTATGGDSFISEGGTTYLGLDQIGLADVDTDPSSDDLYFRVTDLPKYGELQRWNGSDWVEVKEDDLISEKLLESSFDGKDSGLRYIHDGTENFTDSLTFQVRDDLAYDNNATDVKSYASENAPDETDANDNQLPVYQQHLSEEATVTLNITPINDAPIIQENSGDPDVTIIGSDGTTEVSSHNSKLTVAEGGDATIEGDNLTVVDPDTDNKVLQYRITTNVENGTLLLDGVALGKGSRFTQADIDSDALVYRHDGSETTDDGFDFIVSDSVSDHYYDTGENGDPPGVSHFKIDINGARNDAPTIENGGDKTVDLFSQSENDDGFRTHSFKKGDLSITDVDLDEISDGETDFVQVRLELTNDSDSSAVTLGTNGSGSDAIIGFNKSADGNVTIFNAGSDGSKNTNGDLLVIQGTKEAVQNALNNMKITVPETDLDGTYSLDVSVDDRLRDESDGTLTSGANGGDENEDGSPIDSDNNVDTTTITFRVSDENDPPEITDKLSDKTVDEDTVLHLNGYQINDPDAFDSELTVTVTVGEHGHLSVDGDATTGDESELTLTGTVDELNEQLDNLTYIGDQDWHGSDSLEITVNDKGGNGWGGDHEANHNIDITVDPVNDGPSVDVPDTQTIADESDPSVTFSDANGNAITLSDAADYDNKPVHDEVQVTVKTDGNGKFTGYNDAGVTIVGSQDGSDGTLVLKGTLEHLNDALDGLVYTPTEGNGDHVDEITVTMDDLGNGSNDAIENNEADNDNALTDQGTFKVQISGQNDPPGIELGGDTDAETTTLTGTEDQSLDITDIQISDPDDFGKDMQVTITSNEGFGELSVTDNNGADVAVSNNGHTITLTGSKTELNDALKTLVYTPNDNFHTQDVDGDTLTVEIDDLGNTGTMPDDANDFDDNVSIVTDGDGNKSLVRTKEVTINIDPVNDRPDASGDPADLGHVNEDTDGGPGQRLSDLLADNYSDNTDNQTNDSGGDTATGLSYVAIVGNDANSDQGTWQVSDGNGGWIDVPSRDLGSDKALLGSDKALVVEAGREVRFNPAGDFFGKPGELHVRLADGDDLDSSQGITTSDSATDLKDLSTDGNGADETGRWSKDTVDIKIAVDNVNDRPTGENGMLESIYEGTMNPDGATVSDLFGDGYSDAVDNQSAIDGGGKAVGDFGGIAIVGNAADNDQGTWQYSTDNGDSWTNIDTDISDSDAVILSKDAKLRFKPADGDYNDNTDAGAPGDLTVRLADIDQSAATKQNITGNLDETSHWSEKVTLSTSVKPVNDAPSAEPSKNNIDVDQSTEKSIENFMDNIHTGGANDENSQTVSFGVIKTEVTDQPDDSGFGVSDLFTDNGQPTFGDTDGDNTLSFTTSDILGKDETAQVKVTVSVKDTGGKDNGGHDTGDEQTFTITIHGQNDAPETVDGSIGHQSNNDSEGGINVDVTGAFSDPDQNDSLTYTAENLPKGLEIDKDTGKITGTIDHSASQGGNTGTKGEYEITITADDGHGGTVDQTFTWTIKNLEPTANDDSNHTEKDDVLNVDANNGMLRNDSDRDGDELTVSEAGGETLTDGNPVTIEGNNGGQFTIHSDGSYEFDPGDDFSSLGPNDSESTEIDYTVSDGEGGTDTATLTVKVTGVNTPPTANPDQGATDQNTIISGDVIDNATGSDTDAETPDALKVSKVGIDGDHLDGSNVNEPVKGSSGGQFTIHENGSYEFDPNGEFDDLAKGETRETTVTYEVSDGDKTDTTTVTVTVTGTNDAPIVTDNPPTAKTVHDGDTLDISTSDWFHDPDTNDELTYSADGLPDGITIDKTTGVIHGNVPADASQHGGDGEYTITVTATDGDGETATHELTLTSKNVDPEAHNDSNTTQAGDSLSVGSSGGVLSNDVDGGNDHDDLTVSAVDGDGGNVDGAVGGDNGGSFIIHTDGSYSFDPGHDFDDLGPGQSETTTVHYTINDGEGGTSTATLTVTVTGKPAPVINTPEPIEPPTGNTGVPFHSEGVGGDTPPSPLDEGTDQAMPPTIAVPFVPPDSGNGMPGMTGQRGEGPGLRQHELDINPLTNDRLDMPYSADNVNYQATLTNGQPLPGTLAIDTNTGQISGHLPPGQERAHLTVITISGDGHTRTHEVWVNSDGDVIKDVEQSDSAKSSADDIRYQAIQQDGSQLPGTLTINSDTGQFEGQLPPGVQRARVTVIEVHDDGTTQTREVWVDHNGKIIDDGSGSSDGSAPAVDGQPDEQGQVSVNWQPLIDHVNRELADAGDVAASSHGARIVAALGLS